jgi:hypothetical protein
MARQAFNLQHLQPTTFSELETAVAGAKTSSTTILITKDIALQQPLSLIEFKPVVIIGQTAGGVFPVLRCADGNQGISIRYAAKYHLPCLRGV